MRRETRTILVMSVLLLGGTGALWLSAHRYTKILQARQGGGAAEARSGPAVGAGERDAAAAIDGFVGVRRAMHAVAAGLGDPAGQADPRVARLTMTRDRALASNGVSLAEYVKLRRAYRAWRAGRDHAGADLTREFEARRAELAAADLGAWEPYDR